MRKGNKERLKAIPKFRSQSEERRFWGKHDSVHYIDWQKAVLNPAFPELKPSTHTVSLRLSDSLLNEIKRLAHQQDVPYQSLMKIFLAEKIREVSA
ncbi:MAG: BrnA antitoxin family protein [Candidatus Omnitrophica bacterium]|nr:BrnA antitoxin family protein [Candidatus Omnitrophota bacterium]